MRPLRRLKFRHRIGLLVSLAALALIALTAVTLVLGRQNEAQLDGIETRYVPLIELDRDLKTLLAQIPRALEDAANAADDAKLQEADKLVVELVSRLRAGAATIADNGGNAAALETELQTYYTRARAISSALVSGTPAGQLASQIEAMHQAQQVFVTQLDTATTPDRTRLADAFAQARTSQRTSMEIDIVVVCLALALMTWLSWRITREAMSRAQGEREDWIKTGLAELAQQIAGDLDRKSLGDRAVRYLREYVGARDAALRLTDEGTASSDREIRMEHRAGGAGHVVLVPLLHDERALGVLELTLSEPPGELAIDLLGRIRSVLGVALRVAETRERARALLVETQRQAAAAETANKELEAFSYSVSHDLRAPLRGIDGFSQALLEDYADALPAKAQDYFRRIRAGAQRMAELIDDLLQLSRVSRGEFRRERVDLTALFKQIVADLRRAEPERTVEAIVPEGILADADPKLVRIALENLVGNAWKFSAKTGAARIELGARERAGEQVYFVRDNGAGFDMKYADRLFGAFQRLHSDKEFPGTGIGLATVQRIVLRHGGRISVEAAVGQGATFEFTLAGPKPGASSS